MPSTRVVPYPISSNANVGISSTKKICNHLILFKVFSVILY